jgi:hypothetical protein
MIELLFPEATFLLALLVIAIIMFAFHFVLFTIDGLDMTNIVALGMYAVTIIVIISIPDSGFQMINVTTVKP